MASPPAVPEPSESDIDVSGAGITVVQRHRTIHMHRVTDEELTTVSAPSGSVYFGLFGITIGILATALTTLATVKIEDPRTYASFWAAAIVSVVLGLLFGWKSFEEIVTARAVVERVRGGPVETSPQLCKGVDPG